ncbi:MAG TPA: GNAT family N-acetyltransferase [Rhodothermales bacterium]|nr:GNAT family N-acetyltransferase [Rhodothermales bacterium]
MQSLEITTATSGDIDGLTPLFDGYRAFYGQQSDPGRARSFLLDRLERRESVIFIARVAGKPAGFIQMYPSFSSVSTGRIWILNDLYVVADKRRLGVARDLILHARDWARSQRAVRLVLETARGNGPAKTLYESLGWSRDNEFHRYSIELHQD